MQAVVNRIALKEPLDDEVFAAAQRELPKRIEAIDGIESFHVLRTGSLELTIVIVGEDEQTLDRLRQEVGNAWMREHVVPHAARPSERVVGDILVAYTRSPAGS